MGKNPDASVQTSEATAAHPVSAVRRRSCGFGLAAWLVLLLSILPHCTSSPSQGNGCLTGDGLGGFNRTSPSSPSQDDGCSTTSGSLGSGLGPCVAAPPGYPGITCDAGQQGYLCFGGYSLADAGVLPSAWPCNPPSHYDDAGVTQYCCDPCRAVEPGGLEPTCEAGAATYECGMWTPLDAGIPAAASDSFTWDGGGATTSYCIATEDGGEGGTAITPLDGGTDGATPSDAGSDATPDATSADGASDAADE